MAAENEINYRLYVTFKMEGQLLPSMKPAWCCIAAWCQVVSWLSSEVVSLFWSFKWHLSLAFKMNFVSKTPVDCTRRVLFSWGSPRGSADILCFQQNRKSHSYFCHMPKHDYPRIGQQDNSPVGSRGEVPRGLMYSEKRKCCSPPKRPKSWWNWHAMTPALGWDELYEVHFFWSAWGA